MGASLGDPYPNLHASNFVEHSIASRLHARLVSNRVHTLDRKRSVAIDARGQLVIDKGLRKSDTPARRAQLSSTQAHLTAVRRRTGHANHGLASLPNDPPAQSAAPTGPVQFVPRKANEFAPTAEPPSLMTGDEEWPPDDDDSAVDAGQPASENARASPPLGAQSSLSPFFCSPAQRLTAAGDASSPPPSSSPGPSTPTSETVVLWGGGTPASTRSNTRFFITAFQPRSSPKTTSSSNEFFGTASPPPISSTAPARLARPSARPPFWSPPASRANRSPRAAPS